METMDVEECKMMPPKVSLLDTYPIILAVEDLNSKDYRIRVEKKDLGWHHLP
jgi:hypothetical protein